MTDNEQGDDIAATPPDDTKPVADTDLVTDADVPQFDEFAPIPPKIIPKINIDDVVVQDVAPAEEREEYRNKMDVQTTVMLPRTLRKKAKGFGINMSVVCRNALKIVVAKMEAEANAKDLLADIQPTTRKKPREKRV